MFLANTGKNTAPKPRGKFLAALGRLGRAEAECYFSACPMPRATPLYSLPVLARSLGIASLHVKDEGQRLGLGSFKALGGAYAVMKQVVAEAERHLGCPVDPAELQSDRVRDIARKMTVACATDGNHGRSVAAGARIVGCRAVVFIHAGVSESRAAAIAGFGAEIIRVAGAYDESVVEATQQSRLNGWTIISDTAWEGYEDIPLDVMQGYTVMAGEAFDALPAPPTHLFLQAGVGGMAAAVAAHAADLYGDAIPRIIVVEPARAACLFESGKAGRAVTIAHGEATVMAMLECFTPSLIAWEILHPLADGFLTLPEEVAIDAMKRLAQPGGDDPAILAGESGGTGLAGLIAALADPEVATCLGLGADSHVLVFNSEGATDAAIFQQLTGLRPNETGADHDLA